MNGGCTNVANTTKQLVDLVEAVISSSFQINAQIYQMDYSDLDIPTAIRASGQMIKLVHVADVVGFNPLVGEAFVSELREGRAFLEAKWNRV